MRTLVYYDNLFQSMIIKNSQEIINVVNDIDRDWYKWYCKTYQKGIDWKFVAIIHRLECDGDVNKQILNGENWNTKTKLVPKNLGPFKSWDDAANKAFLLKGIITIPNTISNILWECERWNGWGYVKKKINSPYIWSKTNHYICGKFTSDGKFSSTAVSKQIGAAPLLCYLL